VSTARKVGPPPKPVEFWERAPKPRSYSIGDISRRENEPTMQLECKRCGGLIPQQLVWMPLPKNPNPKPWWMGLGCDRCPLELRA
jgi:hypothetical protein